MGKGSASVGPNFFPKYFEILIYIFIILFYNTTIGTRERNPEMTNPRYQVKADGYRTRTYSYSNMGFDNAISWACYLVECENAENVRFIERKPDGTETIKSGANNLLNMMG